MRVGHILCGGGVDTAALLGALMDAGASVEGVEVAVGSLGSGDVRLTVGRLRRGGLPVVAARVRAPQGTPRADRLGTVRAILDGAALPDPVRQTAGSVLAALVGARARVAGTSPRDLDLHPVRTLDDLAGIVAVCTAVHHLGLEEITCGPVSVGIGLAEAAGGVRPVPGPVVTALLAGFPRREVPLAAELVTPPGAALLAGLAHPDPAPPPLRFEGCGAGVGHRALGAAGALRLLVGVRTAAATGAG